MIISCLNNYNQAYMTSFLKLWLATSFLFSAADFIFSWNPLAAAPYLAHRQEAIFRIQPALNFGMLAELINGLIAASAFIFIGCRIEGSPARQGILFGLILWGFWVVSGTMSAFVWLNVPISLAMANVVFGLPKCLMIGYGTAWGWNRLNSTVSGHTH